MVTADYLGYAFSVGTGVTVRASGATFMVCGFAVADRALTPVEAQSIANTADGTAVAHVHYWREIAVTVPPMTCGDPATGDQTIVWGN